MKTTDLFRLMFLLAIGSLRCFTVEAQSCQDIQLNQLYDIPATCNAMSLTMKEDNTGKPFLYIAAKEGGLNIYNISGTPVFTDNLPISLFNGLHVMNLSQVGDYLYLALGNHFLTLQHSGMAIIDVSDPEDASLTDYWESTENGGGGIVEVTGHYACLGGMRNGLIILDIADKNNIGFVSQFVPSLSYPDANPDPDKINARGMAIREDIVYLCYDAGGMRIINISDKAHPVETGRYANPQLNNLPRAYNNIVVENQLAYIAVDYCGLEILDISDTAQIQLVGWWNPWNCQTNPFNWFFSPGHANEIAFDADCRRIFLSTGKSDMYIVDVENPALPDSCGIFGGVGNMIGTWGLSKQGSRVYLGYICAAVPFSSDWSGVRVLDYQSGCPSPTGDISESDDIRIYPNPAGRFVVVDPLPADATIYMYSLSGTLVAKSNHYVISTANLAAGIYFMRIQSHGQNLVKRLIIDAERL